MLTGAPAIPGEIEIANLTIRPDEQQVLVEGRRAGLTAREFELLQVLAERPDRVIQRREIYAAIWGGEMRRRDRSVDVLVRKIRSKLSAIAPGWEYIHTHFGIGYRFNPEPIPEDGSEPVGPYNSGVGV